jgi:hypothetical protein
VEGRGSVLYLLDMVEMHKKGVFLEMVWRAMPVLFGLIFYRGATYDPTGCDV